MNDQKLNETIEVIAHFDGKTVYPLRFKWKDKAYKITQEVIRWDDNKIEPKKLHFIIFTQANDKFEIVYDRETLIWHIEKAELQKKMN